MYWLIYFNDDNNKNCSIFVWLFIRLNFFSANDILWYNQPIIFFIMMVMTMDDDNDVNNNDDNTMMMVT